MAKVFFVTLLLHAPIILMIGGFCFLLARWSLRRQVFNKLIKAMLLLCLIAFSIGVVYGIMRFSGLIIFADDNFNS